MTAAMNRRQAESHESLLSDGRGAKEEKERSEFNPEVVRVLPEADYTLHLWFDSGEESTLDMKPYLDGGPVFRALRDPAMFNSVHPFMGTVQWNNNADLCPDTVYLDSVKI